jgi:hypothetical protein
MFTHETVSAEANDLRHQKLGRYRKLPTIEPVAEGEYFGDLDAPPMHLR